MNLVLDTIRLAMKREKKRIATELQLHSGQGFQYTSQAYGITPSMSRKRNPYDNAMAENSFSKANEMIDRYIRFYNHERVQLKTGEAPLPRHLSY